MYEWLVSFFKIRSISDMMPVLLPSSTTECRICYGFDEGFVWLRLQWVKSFRVFSFSEASVTLNNRELDDLSE